MKAIIFAIVLMASFSVASAQSTVITEYFLNAHSQMQVFYDHTAQLEAAMVYALDVDPSVVTLQTVSVDGVNAKAEYVIQGTHTYTDTQKDRYLRHLTLTDDLDWASGAYQSTMISFNGDTTPQDLHDYQTALVEAFANVLGVDVTVTYPAGSVAAETTFNNVQVDPEDGIAYKGLNVVIFEWFKTSTAEANFNDAQFGQKWTAELAQIEGFNAIVGLVTTTTTTPDSSGMSVTVTISDLSVSGYTLNYQITNPVTTENIYYYTSSSATAPSVADITGGSLSCSGSTMQTVNEESFYSACSLQHGVTYYLYLYVQTGNGVGSMSQAISFTPAEPSNVVPYSYMFTSDLNDVITQQLAILESFALALGVETAYVGLASVQPVTGGTVLGLSYPYNTYLAARVTAETFIPLFEQTMREHSTGLAVLVPQSNLLPYYSTGGYEWASQAIAQQQCEAIGSGYNLCSKDQLYTIVYVGVDGHQVPEMCYSGWTSNGEAGWYHNDDNSCGGINGWRGWSPATPGAHCCSDFSANLPTKDWYVFHPERYAFTDGAVAQQACQDMDSSYDLCSKEQIMGIAHFDSDFDKPDMCIGAYYKDKDGFNTGFYVADNTAYCQSGKEGWHDWNFNGKYGAHCCIPSYLDSRTETLYYGISKDSNGQSTFDAAKAFCAATQYHTNICESGKLHNVAQSENRNICSSGWVAVDSTDSGVGMVGWWQGEETLSGCGSVGWNDYVSDFPIPHCCLDYVMAYGDMSLEMQTVPSSYDDGFSTGAAARDYCIASGYDDLCTKGQVVWWATNEAPNACRSAWVWSSEFKVDYTTGWQGYDGCGTAGQWLGWAPDTPVAHCCESTVASIASSTIPYVKSGNYVYDSATAAAAQCTGEYSLCSYAQLYRVAYADVDGFSDTNICYTGWVSDGLTGWWQADGTTCGNNPGWRTWTNNGLAGAHCCTSFEGATIPDEYTTTTTTAAPECAYVSLSQDGGSTPFDATYQMGNTVNGKHEFTSTSGDRISFDGEVWMVYGSTGDSFVGRVSLDTMFPPTLATWDYIADPTVTSAVAYENVRIECLDTLYFVGGTATGLINGYTSTLTLNGGAETITIGSADPSWQFTTAFVTGQSYEVAIVSSPDNFVCQLSSFAGNVADGNVNGVSLSCNPVTFPVGGTIAGLSGSIILISGVASNNDMVTINRDGGWTFPDPIATGAAYSVSIVVQPTGQHCEITSGVTGTVAMAVNDITIECTSELYSIGGTVTGLANGESVYLVSGTDLLTVTGHGAFTFPTQVAFGSNYLVSVHTTPDEYSCSVTNPIGTVGGDVNNVIVVCVPFEGTSYSVEINFLEVRHCLNANSIQIAEWTFYDEDQQPLYYDGAISSPADTPRSGKETVSNIHDGNIQNKWLDYNMGKCDASVNVHGITFDTEPHYFNFATANDEPNRDPKEWTVQICTLVSGIVAECKTLRYLVEDLTTERNVYIRPPFSLVANTLSVTVVDNTGTVVLENLDNAYDDALIFTTPGTQTFQFQISTGSSYNIEVVTQPDGQQCTVTENGNGIAYGAVSVSVYCTAGCDTPSWLPELYGLNFSTTLGANLCMIGPQYYWNGQPLCLAGSSDTEGECDHQNYVCAGVIGRTYGSFQAQKEALEEVLRADEQCLTDGAICDIDHDSCCNPYSQCLWNLEDSFEFEARCTQCKDCDVWLNECDKCRYQPGEAVRSYRCPAQNCQPLTAEPVFEPAYWGAQIDYCELNNYIYMNGMLLCVDTTVYSDAQSLYNKLYDVWWNDFYLGTNDCPDVTEPKDFDLLLLDHIGIIGGYTTYYLNLTEFALDNCCLSESDFADYDFAQWTQDIDYIQSTASRYTADIQSQINSIVSQLNSLKTSLEGV